MSFSDRIFLICLNRQPRKRLSKLFHSPLFSFLLFIGLINSSQLSKVIDFLFLKYRT